VLAALVVLALGGCSEPETHIVEASTTTDTATPAPESSAPAVIPAVLQGRWNVDPRNCARPGPGSLEITADAVVFPNHRAQISAVETDGKNFVMIGSFADNSATWVDSLKYSVTPDHQRLTDVNSRAVLTICP